MDFRASSTTDDSDEAILDKPYRPFYNIFGSAPILVKQYMLRFVTNVPCLTNMFQEQRL